MGHQKKPPPRSRPAPAEADASLPSLELLEQFPHASLSQWKAAGRTLAALSNALFFGLESQRAENANALVDAVRLGITGPFAFQDWARIVDWRYSTVPLSTAGSVRGDGGRFNIGSTLNPAAYSPFPALYSPIGDDADLQEVYDTERHLLYVACTRARDHLLVTGVAPASEFLDDLRQR